MFKKKKTYIILALILAIIGGVYYFKSKKPQTEYTTATAKKEKITETVSVTGKIAPLIEADLSFKLSGQVESLLVEVGDHVIRGQKIATIDKGTLQEQLSAAREEVRNQRNTLYNMKKRNETYNDYQREAQRTVIKKAEESLKEAEINISETVLYSPINGTVIKRNVEVGEMTVANAVTDNTSVVTIAADGDLEIEVDIPESDIVRIKNGQKAKVTLDALSSDEIIGAEIVKIEPASTVIQDVVYYKVKLKLEKQDDRLKVGMSVDADINITEKNDVITIPLRAVKNNGQGKYVEILKEDKTIEKKNVKTGLEGDEGMVEIISGISEGENVITFTKTL
jgi:RND family efflux transporter MFP subunit